MPFADPVANPLGSLQAMMQEQIGARREAKEQMGTLQRIAPRDESTEEAERWSALAAAAGSTPPVAGGFGMMLANIGGAYGKVLSEQEQRNFERQALIAKLMEQGGGSLGSGSLTAMTQAMLNPMMNIGGQGVSRLTGEVIVPSDKTDQFNSLVKKFLDIAVEQKMPNPEVFARNAATEVMRRGLTNPELAGARTVPFSSGTRTPPGEPQPSASSGDNVALAPVGTVTPDEGKITRDRMSWIMKLKQDESRAVAEGDFERASELRRAQQAMKMDAPKSVEYRDIPKAEMEKATATKTGESLGTTMDDLQTAASASSDLKIQLNALRELYKTPNLPEGQQAEMIQGLRSSLKSLGMDIGSEVGAGDMVTAIGGKLALLTRTADGKNLMPGAMSDFEQQILRSLAPGLKQTSEGRAALVEFLSDMADVRIRLAKEASSMASENRGILPPDWYTRRDRVLKEEMARMSIKSREMAARFQGAKK